MNYWARARGNLADFTGTSLLRFQLILCGIALAVSAMFWLTQGSPDFVSTLMFTLVVGNFTNASLAIAAPLFSKRRFPLDWIVYLALLVPIGAVGSLLSTLLLLAVFGHKGPRIEWMVANIEV